MLDVFPHGESRFFATVVNHSSTNGLLIDYLQKIAVDSLSCLRLDVHLDRITDIMILYSFFLRCWPIRVLTFCVYYYTLRFKGSMFPIST